MRRDPHIHILGICGTFMGGLAAIARESGCVVVGSDQNVYPPMSTALDALGVELLSGYEAAHLHTRPDEVIVGNALKRGNPAVEYLLDQGIPYTSGPGWLFERVLQFRHVLAVAGTHGKTTTSAMLTTILLQHDLDPGYLIGGVVNDLPSTAALGGAEYFVIEADEYDTAFFDKRPKFMHYRPRTLILNNCEFDHADIFEDLSAIKQQFSYLLRSVPSTGKVIVNANDANLAAVLSAGCWSHVETFGDGGDWQAVNVNADCTAFDVAYHGKIEGHVSWTLLGCHNIENALAAIAAANDVDVPVAVACEALSHFSGVKRRLEYRGEINGVSVYDDFAHHPTAIRATIDGLRRRVGTERIIAVLQLGSNTMKAGVHGSALGEALLAADDVLILNPNVTDFPMQQVLEPLGDKGMACDTVEAILTQLRDTTQPSDHVLMMSNQGFEDIHARFLS